MQQLKIAITIKIKNHEKYNYIHLRRVFGADIYFFSYHGIISIFNVFFIKAFKALATKMNNGPSHLVFILTSSQINNRIPVIYLFTVKI